METPVKYMCVLTFLVSMTIAGLNGVEGTAYYYGPCGKHDIEKEAEKLEPCTYAAQNRRVPVSKCCCTEMEKIQPAYALFFILKQHIQCGSEAGNCGDHSETLQHC
ncbi:Kinase superfamily protein [Hibiscus syriacus]|uniref:Kinase superfamily protein n=1 Tax=Hibiscus syriacus TaxID=106335 RepID=A0A6A2X926_HIBSY|nr:Kinase superfamily protein [Hibiscus syriacus]